MDDYATDQEYRNDVGGLFRLEIDGPRPERLEVIPTRISHEWLPAGSCPPYRSQVNLAQGEDLSWALDKVSRLSSELGMTRLVADKDRLIVQL